MKRSVGAALFAILLFALAGRLLAQNPALGTWKLNVAKSKYDPGPAPQSMTRTVEAQGDKVKYTFEGVASDGSAISYSYTVAYDGKDYPLSGRHPNGADSISAKKLSSRSYEATLKKRRRASVHFTSGNIRGRQGHHYHPNQPRWKRFGKEPDRFREAVVRPGKYPPITDSWPRFTRHLTAWLCAAKCEESEIVG